MTDIEVIDLHADDQRPDKDHVKNFAQKMAGMGFIFIAFLAPWCGHCKNFKPEWERTKHHIKKGHAGRIRGHVVTTDDNVMQQLPSSMKKPQGFPTMSLYEGTRHITDYDGGRNMHEIIKFLKKHMSRGKKRKRQQGGYYKTLRTRKKRRRSRSRRRKKKRKATKRKRKRKRR
jgi:thioredoxin-like negative regulator of GroEL